MFGFEISKKRSKQSMIFPAELNSVDQDIVSSIKVNELSMVPDEGLFATLLSCKYVIRNNIPGDFVECGVWRGGCSIIAASTFKSNNTHKSIFLYDTFKGMTKPSQDDYAINSGELAENQYSQNQKSTHNDWSFASLNDVKRNFKKFGLLDEKIHFIEGDVLLSLRNEALIPDLISVLRLDTDWYESTKIELEVLYPRLSIGGVLIIDDYGYWSGSKKAADEFFNKLPFSPCFHIIDVMGGRIAVKTR